MLYTSEYLSPLGQLLLLANDEALLGLWFTDQKYYGASYPLAEAVAQENKITAEVTDWLEAYFAGQQPPIALLSLAPAVTTFREKVLRILQDIPYGEVVTYQQIVDRLKATYGEKIGSARAVGGAVGHNPISIIIPCHRVIGSNGSLTGYAGGLARKQALLRLEGIDFDTRH